jgi:hypothetical protein
MILTVGQLDPEAIRDCVAVAITPLDARLILHLFAEFPELTAEQKDGDVAIPWHGLGRARENKDSRPGSWTPQVALPQTRGVDD